MTENDRVFLEISLELLRQGCRVRFRPGGQSMHPTIKDGEAILVEPANPAQIKRGDIILYRFERGVIAHRVKNIPSSDTFITRGDSSFTDDQPVPLNDVLGRVVAVERNGRAVALVGQAARWRRIGRVLLSRLKSWFVKKR